MPEYDSKENLRREILEGFQTANATKRSGDGIQDSDHILLGRFSDYLFCQRLRAQLSSAGIQSNTSSDRTQVSVFVPHRNRETAFGILAEHKLQHPEARPTGAHRDYDITFLIAGLSFVPTVILVLSGRPLTALAFWVSGVSAGFIFDRCQRNRRWYGSYQFTLKEVLAFTGIIALLIALWRLVRPGCT
jgi:hypothetical protein